MRKIFIVLIVLIAAIAVVGLLEYTQGTFSALAFDQIDYNYHSQVTIPPSGTSGSYMGGYYDINGTGRNFNMVLVLSGAEQGESPLDYTSDGLKVTGFIDTVKVTPQTINYLVRNDIKSAMFNTIFNGNMNMTCAAWTGTSLFANDGENFNGTFKIDGIYTDWEGNYTFTHENNRIVITADYFYWSKKTPESRLPVHSVYLL
ncbi:MAG TPA: hypothetical protein PLC38_01525 [Methanobacterium sp.]|jgi:hypothetical protein|nr:MAG: hypothetical protein FGO69_04600 [Methanobacterium sp.]HOI39802.1 hypothetical protein [Methanobacterium sp.]HOI70945.1 hypothetical protein [Methanobacterium sp.]